MTATAPDHKKSSPTIAHKQYNYNNMTIAEIEDKKSYGKKKYFSCN